MAVRGPSRLPRTPHRAIKSAVVALVVTVQAVSVRVTRSAGVLREHDLPTSTAHVIEAVRLARTLAQLRDRPEPGLTEVTDATRAVLCEGSETAVGFGSTRLTLGVSGFSLVSTALFVVFLCEAFAFCTTAGLVARGAFGVFGENALSPFTALCAAGFAGSWVFGVGHTAVRVGFAVGRSLRAVQSSVLPA